MSHLKVVASIYLLWWSPVKISSLARSLVV